jgi:hypothetical protein
MTKRLLAVAILLFAAALANAQQLPPGKWWRQPRVVEQLSLTIDQQDRLDEVFRAAANDLIDAKGAVEKLQIALRGELERTQLRRGEIQRIAGQLNDARGRLFERELMMLVDMRGVLNDAQWNRMRTFLDRMQEQRRGQNQGQQPGPVRPNPRRRPK